RLYVFFHVGLLGLLFMTPTLAAQSPSSTANEIDIRSNAMGQSPHLVSVEQLQHRVPKKAQTEMAKALRAAAAHRTDAVIEHLRLAVSTDPEWVSARVNLAVRLMAENTAAAIEQLQEAAKIEAGNAVVLTNLSVAYAVAGDLENAERWARQSIRIDPN